MSMKLYYTCDKCKCKDINEKRKMHFNIWHGVNLKMTHKYDLCPICYKKFKKFMNNTRSD